MGFPSFLPGSTTGLSLALLGYPLADCFLGAPAVAAVALVDLVNHLAGAVGRLGRVVLPTVGGALQQRVRRLVDLVNHLAGAVGRLGRFGLASSGALSCTRVVGWIYNGIAAFASGCM